MSNELEKDLKLMHEKVEELTAKLRQKDIEILEKTNDLSMTTNCPYLRLNPTKLIVMSQTWKKLPIIDKNQNKKNLNH